MPLGPTPPKGSSGIATWYTVVLMAAPPDRVRSTTRSAVASSALNT